RRSMTRPLPGCCRPSRAAGRRSRTRNGSPRSATARAPTWALERSIVTPRRYSSGPPARCGWCTRPTLPRSFLVDGPTGSTRRGALLWDVTSRAMPGIDRVIATGGTLLALPWLIQLFADAIDRPLLMSLAGEGSARGAAIVALERIGALPDIAAVRSPLGRTF